MGKQHIPKPVEREGDDAQIVIEPGSNTSLNSERRASYNLPNDATRNPVVKLLKRGKKETPCDDQGIPLHLDAEGRRRLIIVRKWAKYLDTAIRIPGLGWEFGIDPIVGLIPGFGDLVGAGLGSTVIALAAKWRLPKRALVRMTINQGIDFFVGIIPFFGDIFDFVFKANKMNLYIIECYIVDEKRARSADGKFYCCLLTTMISMWIIFFAIIGLIIWGIIALVNS
ncbi:hypothetical protein SARC_03065 [Sphaeroforma arctica JP610]|uniref:DUF4112 domain-containing protein n=1 Tax=Sphaeroforma arctica JP610 TaxID=667725 RepID=A0A0L0G728_9EUKA|nr:hypothetical protein SARC_03065 [Sphaeroforma arctica JP610]KNC84724.1 hypothetical protein SARC_03065 [Sphaeroforma arctica JP610]|eukprot:XP_014158626.1 hypothetical protein SARC_03065 [Sphaeroforma arctica JP610]